MFLLQTHWSGLDSWDSGLPLWRFPREILKKNEENEWFKPLEIFRRRRIQQSFSWEKDFKIVLKKKKEKNSKSLWSTKLLLYKLATKFEQSLSPGTHISGTLPEEATEWPTTHQGKYTALWFRPAYFLIKNIAVVWSPCRFRVQDFQKAAAESSSSHSRKSPPKKCRKPADENTNKKQQQQQWCKSSFTNWYLSAYSKAPEAHEKAESRELWNWVQLWCQWWYLICGRIMPLPSCFCCCGGRFWGL